MRLLALAAPCLTGLLLAGTALAGPTSGWVDPPAKVEGGRSEASTPKTPEPAKLKAETKTEAKAEKKPAAAAQSDVAESRPKAESRRSRRLARQEERRERRTARGEPRGRLAASSEIDATAPDPRFAGWAGQAQRLADAYLDSVSAPNASMLAAAPRFYGERVRFHGRSMSIAALIAEKRRFARRWPERHYAAQDGTMRTACHAATATCILRTVITYTAENPARGARSQGLSELTLTVGFEGDRPVILSESSRVLRRGSAAVSAAERGRHGGA